MMCHHLPVVFSPGLCIDDQNLVEVERGLEEVVELDRASKGYVGVVSPDVDWVQHGRRQVPMNILRKVSSVHGVQKSIIEF